MAVNHDIAVVGHGAASEKHGRSNGAI